MRFYNNFFIFTLYGFGALLLPRFLLRDQAEVLDIEPQKTVDTAVLPLYYAERIEDIISMGDYREGYLHLMPTRITEEGEDILDGGHHLGTDFNLGYGNDDLKQPIVLTMNGVCIYYGEDNSPGLGNTAIFRHRLPNGEGLLSRFSHLHLCWAMPGLNYKAGDMVGLMGRSGLVDDKGNYNMTVHEHYDIADEFVLELYAGEWPGPRWYPYKQPIEYIMQYFFDPVEIILTYLHDNQRSSFTLEKYLNLRKELHLP